MASGTFTFFSRKLGKSVNINVVLPECECPENGFRVIYLLHGWHKAMRRIYGDAFPDLIGTDYDAFHLAKKIDEAGGPYPQIFHYMGSDETDGMRWSVEMEKFFLSFPGNPFCYRFVTYPGIHTWESWDAHIEEALDTLGLTPVH